MVNDSDTLIRHLVAGDLAGVHRMLEADDTTGTALRFLVAALVSDDPGPLLERASDLARTTRDRQLVAITAAHQAGETDRLGALVRDHLIDHPDSLLAAWIATEHAGTVGTDPQE